MNEQAKVGLMVVISGAILITAILYMTEFGLGAKYDRYKMYLNFAGGLEPGSPVRFGGLKAGRVKSLRVAPDARIEIELEINQNSPPRKDSVAALSQLGMLGENYVEIQPGKAQEKLPAGSVIPSVETQDMVALMRRMNLLAEQAQPLLADLHKNMNMVSAQIDAVLTDVRLITGEANRAQFASILRNTNDMIAKNSPRIEAITANFQAASTKLDPMMNDLRGTTARLDKLILELNGMVGENRKEVQAAVATLTKTLETTRAMMNQLNATITDNSQNMDQIMQNMRVTSDNLTELSDTLRQRPFSLIRTIPKPERQVPGAAPNGNTKGTRR